MSDEDRRDAFDLDPEVHHLNHGSFGAVTRTVQAAQEAMRREMERDTMGFFTERVLPGIDRARRRVAAFVGARPDDLVFVRNATEAVSAVLRSLGLTPDDEIVVSEHEYAACVKACHLTGARVVTARIPLPVVGPEAVLDGIEEALGPRTRLVLVSHVTSPTGIVFPIPDLLERLSARGIPALVDGAHAPGMLPLDLGRLEARGLAWYAANLHKWVCAPKGSGFLWARPDLQDELRPPVTSHGEGAVWPGRTAFQTRFDWTGTWDPSPWLVVPEALDALASLHPDGLDGVRRANRDLALAARGLLLAAVGTPPLAPPSMLGSLAAIRLPDDPGPPRPHPLAMSNLQARLHAEGYRVPVSDWPAPPRRLLRISAHRYNRIDDYALLAERLRALLADEGA